jgi:type I restriction enzyme M protein
VVVPTGFITAQSGIDKKIREKLVEEKMLAGVVPMPSNIFATTGTNVSILFIDKNNKGAVVLIDASGLGETVKEGKNQKTVLTETEEDQIIDTFNNKLAVDDFSVVVSYPIFNSTPLNLAKIMLRVLCKLLIIYKCN